jgi:hypothetical protein
MDQLKGVREGKVTLSMSAEQRASGQKTYDVKEIPSKLQTTFNTLQTGLTVLIVPTEERGKISDEYAKTYFVSRGDDEIKRNVQTSIKNALVNIFLAKEDIPDSHLMVWLVRNSGDRTSEDSGVGIPGIRVLGSVLTRALGKKGTKDVVLVDVNGNVVKNPNIK